MRGRRPCDPGSRHAGRGREQASRPATCPRALSQLQSCEIKHCGTRVCALREKTKKKKKKRKRKVHKTRARASQLWHTALR
eukprot:1730116-Rhodomonas_salina.1